jgi:hypothetical protein
VGITHAFDRARLEPIAPEPPEPSLFARGLTRRQFIRTAAVGAGVAAGSGLWGPLLRPALAAGGTGGLLPRHVHGGLRPFGPGTRVFHVFLPGAGSEPSTITDFDGVVGLASAKGSGTATNGKGEKSTRPFDVDLRFMKGRYIGRDGKEHHGTFGFI